MSQSTQLPVLKAFLTLTPTSSKELNASPSLSKPSSVRGLSNESLPSLPFQKHRGSSSSDCSASSVSSDIGENGFLVLTPHERILENAGLNKISEEAVGE
jgi:hypothetical protein